jgi:hypothetical protein
VANLRYLTAIILLLPQVTLLSQAHADSASDNRTHIVRDCSIDENQTCIQRITLATKSGNATLARLTGRSQTESEFQGGAYDEYEVDNLNFEGPAKNNFIPRIIYYADRNFIQVAIQPSWLDRNSANILDNVIMMPNRADNKLCGTENQRDYCYRSLNFGNEFSFGIELQIPSDFNPTWSSGTVKNLGVQVTPQGRKIGFKTINLTFGNLNRQMDLLSDYYKSPLDAIATSPYADYEADWPNFWVNGDRSVSGMVPSRCSSIAFASLMTNAIYADYPSWNSTDQTINIKLYAPHLRMNGDLNKGFYELEVTKNLAYCLWGIDASSKTRASISISYADGTPDKSIEAYETTFKDDVLTVLATNFTYSSPVVSAKLVDGTSNATTSTSTTTLSGSQVVSNSGKSETSNGTKKISKNISIICIKGTVVKKFSGVNPTCPKGFREKG